MEDFMVLLKRGVIYDGCPIVAKGTVRVHEGGDICIESMHNLMLVDGKNFSDLCGPTRTEQGQLTFPQAEGENWKAKAEDLSKENKRLEKELQSAHKSTSTLLEKLQQEIDMYNSVQSRLAREQRISEETTQVMLEVKTKLCEKVDQMVALQAQLDSTEMALVEKDERLRDSETRQETTREYVARLQHQVAMLDEELVAEKKQTLMHLNDFSEWKNSSEEEIDTLKKEVHHNQTTITTLKNELEIAELEDSEYQQTIVSLRKEVEALRKDLELTARPAVSKGRGPLQKTQRSIKNLMGSMTKPKKSTATSTSTSTATSASTSPSTSALERSAYASFAEQ